MCCLQKPHPQVCTSERDASRLDTFTLPCLEADQCILDAALVVFGHVLMHVRIVLPDVALGAAVGNRPKAKRWGVRVWTLELWGGKNNEKNKKSVSVN